MVIYDASIKIIKFTKPSCLTFLVVKWQTYEVSNFIASDHRPVKMLKICKARILIEINLRETAKERVREREIERERV